MKLLESPECKDFRLDHPDEFASYGCGPGKYSWFVPDTVYGLDVRPACQRHDVDYRHGKGSSNEHRKQCDERFKANMFRIVDAKTSNWVLRRLRFTRCRLYFRMVRIMGHHPYWSERQ